MALALTAAGNVMMLILDGRTDHIETRILRRWSDAIGERLNPFQKDDACSSTP
ncbi:hypothetical protein MKK68_24610 [Methylobacterium sp. E-016]|uniref:hypothetical protein n=1 Tax=Methylobacterium sp. E-016 TaxID=2836556 RepID=UPI001FBA672F|nr:hypothetical protein [Methylobacterium sp. E-016]MCJ2078784.1 hypothetical protein [Methylobacterium sp. E-016]